MNDEEPTKIIDSRRGNTSWTLDRKYHRLGAPAVEYTNGDRSWHVNGERHRLDGPAIDWASSDIKYKWYVRGQIIRTTQLELSINQTIDWNYRGEDLIAIVIKQINSILFQVLIGNKKQYIFSTYHYEG